MNYCIPYFRQSAYKDVSPEIQVLATEKEEFGGIRGFLDTRPQQQRVFFVFRNLFYQLEDADFIYLHALLKDANYTICWEFAGDYDEHIVADKCREYELNFCFSKPAYTYDVLYGLADIGVSDIFISGDIGFDIDSIKRLKRRQRYYNHDITIRAYPDICQSEWQSMTPELTFWMRPEDQLIYEDAIDVLHSWMGIKGQVFADVWYKVYAIDKQWLGNLNILISGLIVNDKGIDSRCFTPQWGEMRCRCGRDCLKTSQCVFCREAIAAAQKIRGLGYIIQEPPDEHGEIYYSLMEEFEKLSQEQRKEIDEKVRKVLGDFYDKVQP